MLANRRAIPKARYPYTDHRQYPRHAVCIPPSTEQPKPCCHPLLTDRHMPNRSGFQSCTNFLPASGLPRPVIHLGRRLVLVRLTLPFLMTHSVQVKTFFWLVPWVTL